VASKRRPAPLVIGVDAASRPENTGLALVKGRLDGAFELSAVEPSCKHVDPVERIATWLEGAVDAILAVDAPLGWPAALSDGLNGHVAGMPLGDDPDLLFRRMTDRRVHETVGKLPLEVGADRIARAARAALELLQRLRERLERTIELGWQCEDRGLRAVEVYPAATLRALRGKPPRYKGDVPDEGAIRRGLLKELEREIRVPANLVEVATARDHGFDAVVAAVGGVDFLRGNCEGPIPGEMELARREGWIWVRRRDVSSM
jgi:predicted RNase H-like nuclease